MRILQIIDALDLGGTAQQLRLLVCGLPRAEFEVHVCALRHAGQIGNVLHDGIAVSALGQRWPADLAAFWRLKRLVAEFRPDAIHAWTPASNAYGCAAARACGVQRFVAGFRRVEPHKGPLARIVDRYAARRAACVVVNSPGVRASCIARGLPADKCRVIPNGVSPARPSNVTRQELLAGLELPDGCRLIGALGPLERRKRLKDAIWAADLLKVIRGDVHLLIAGDGPHRKRLEMFRDQVRIRDKVHFLGARSDLPDLLPHLDVFWATGEYEGQSNAILEAMAAGVPVVASDIAGNRDLVVPEQTGYLVPVGDRAGFARRANRLLDDAPLAERLGRAGRARAELDFAPGRMIEQYAALYRDVGGG